MAGLIILILIGLGGLGYVIILFIGVVISTINAAIKSKKAPPVLTEESKQLFLNSIRTESDYKSDEEFMEYLPSDSDEYNLRSRRAIDILETDGKMPAAISYVLTTIYCPDECRAAQILIWKVIEGNHALYSAMLREKRAAEDWMDKNKKCYYPTSYMQRTFKKYGVTEKLNELRKLGCTVPDDFRPYAPERESKEDCLVRDWEWKQERVMDKYKEDKSMVAEGSWLILAAFLIIGGAIGAFFIASEAEPPLNAIAMLLGAGVIALGLYCVLRAPAAGRAALRNELKQDSEEQNRDEEYPGL